MPVALALLVLLAADPPPPDPAPRRVPTPIEAEMQLMREIEAEEARLAKEEAEAARRAKESPAPVPPPPREVPVTPATAPAVGPSDELRLRVVAGVPLTWRDAEVTPSAGTGVVFRRGSTPYPGILVAAELFPARASRRLPPWLAPVGLGLSYSHAFLSTKVGPERLGSSEQRAAADLLYERRLRPGTALGGRLGYGLHRFGVEEGSPGLTARRQFLRVGVDATQALSRRVSLLGGARFFPWAGVAGAEADAHGSASGWGFELLAGAEGPLPFGAPPDLGWRIAYDVVRFSDRFDSAGGALSRGGTGRALYHGPVVGVTFRR